MKIDLNLLRVFDVLMEVRSASRAAARLGLTQSAVSHALGRLREQLDDPLFLRTRGGLQPTPRARDIAPSIREGLSLLRDASARAAFDPASTTRIFTISASSYFCATVMPGVIRRAREEAPLAQFRIISSTEDPLPALDEGAIDVALGSFTGFPERFAKTLLYSEQLVWVGRVGSDRSDLASRPRLGIARVTQSGEFILPRGSLEQRIGLAGGPTPVMVHDPVSAGALISASDLVALLPRQLATMVSARGQVEILGPSGQEDIELSMLWHSRAASDAAHLWLRGLIRDAGAALG